MQFSKVLDRIEEVNDTINTVMEDMEHLYAKIDDLLSNNVINDEEASELLQYVTRTKDRMDSINGK